MLFYPLEQKPTKENSKMAVVGVQKKPYLAASYTQNHENIAFFKKGKIDLRSQDYEETTQEVESLIVVSLHHSNGTDGVRVTPAVRHPTVGKDGDDDVLLDVEGPAVQAEAPPENLELPPGESGSHESPDGQHRNLH